MTGGGGGHSAAMPTEHWRIGLPILRQASERPNRRYASRQLHRLGTVASHAWAGMAVAVVAVVWVVLGAVLGFPRWWFDGLEASTSVVTVVVLFALQHMSARDQTAIQRKLDEILRALPQADNQLIALEEAPDEALEALTEADLAERAAAVERPAT